MIDPKIHRFLNQHIGMKVLAYLFFVVMVALGMWAIHTGGYWWFYVIGVILISTGTFAIWDMINDKDGK